MAIAKLTTLTPVHVGSGITYNRNIDFVQESGRIGIVDANKVAALIGSDITAIDQWVSAIDKGTPLLDFLRNGRGLRNVKLEDVAERICVLKDTNHQAQNLKEQYRTAIEGVCIPGSSLKGAIKTAVWNYIANSDFVESLTLKDLVVVDREGKPKLTKKGDYIWDDDKLDSQLFGENANEKTTRFLKIGDVHFHNIRTEVHNIQVFNKYPRNWDFKRDDKGAFQQILFESIPSGQSADFDFKIDKLLLERNIEKYPQKWRNQKIYALYHQSDEMVEDFCNLVYDFTDDLLSRDIARLKKEGIAYNNVAGRELLNQYEMVWEELKDCESNEFIIRVGGNSGWDFTTGGWVKELSADKVSDEDFKKLRFAIQKKDRTNTSLWPKTRKTTPNGTIFGFVKIKIEG